MRMKIVATVLSLCIFMVLQGVAIWMANQPNDVIVILGILLVVLDVICLVDMLHMIWSKQLNSTIRLVKGNKTDEN